ncbi:methyltransferase domain-containing protein [Burkholderia humptydooensis]|uniref:Methyltransferase domain-containing protein n=2 Tax=Burkholderia humptydooensis TaxID=430531 RepID=A0A7U4SQN3_9BURK|nr:MULTISPECIES: class I SAM-dependent methyltransferase [Burkholderia]AJY44182.1 methyltransferase small domain protein [Burkholderia sp. 2002721687]ALX41005.1 SAM-dependent methyltransferase [Burkholderia humptydooensis]EIP89393.1 putative methyltransferase [Burkholderia humptydooensis MSMB43]QPS43847.1 methyltransferase domain-containing protein [Burkholderia humptydooensis]
MNVTDRSDNGDSGYSGYSGQAAHWNGRAGRAWADAQQMLDRMFEPFAELLVEAARAGGGRHVLDVGCGAGATTLAVARMLGEQGRCVGVDVSQPLIAAARGRAERERVPASFVHADAQTHAFAPASFDTIISRFGVMFFENAVDAFANLLRAASSDAPLAFIAWRGAAENPFMTTAERAAAPLLPSLPARQPDAPGQFFFGDVRRIEAVLAQSGWRGVDVRPIDVECTLPERELIGHFSRFGPVGQMFADLDDAMRARVVDTVRAAFDPYVHGADVRFMAACWLVKARAPAKWSTRKEAVGV